ncbi:MAG: hypothetical protein MRQ13_01775 [Candidatus Midichloria sp.]|nr:hypothetical protein [Candidatus Midichloria sp.]
MKISSRVFSADYNDAIMTIEEPIVTPYTTTTATLKLTGGFFMVWFESFKYQ